MSTDDEAAILAANRAFYAVFRRRDIGAMKALWARKAPVSCIHPGWPPLMGRDAVMKSWDGILSHPDSPEVVCQDEQVSLIGPRHALVVLIEVIAGNPLAATNVFILEDGEWHLVHHQASPLAGTTQVAVDDEPAPPTGTLLH